MHESSVKTRDIDQDDHLDEPAELNYNIVMPFLTVLANVSKFKKNYERIFDDNTIDYLVSKESHAGLMSKAKLN